MIKIEIKIEIDKLSIEGFIRTAYELASHLF